MQKALCCPARTGAGTQVKDGPGNCAAGSARRLDRAVKPGPFHRFTVSRSGRVSLRRDDVIGHCHLSRFEMGTIVHPVRARFQRRGFDLPAAPATGGIFALPTQVGYRTQPRKRPYVPVRSTSQPSSHSGQEGYPHDQAGARAGWSWDRHQLGSELVNAIDFCAVH